MREVRREAALFAAARAPERRLRRAGRRAPLLAATAAAAACGVATGVFVLDRDASAPAPRTVTAQVASAGARASLVLAEDGARLRVRGLPAPGPGRVYQVWVQATDGSVRPTAALFDVRADGAGTTVVPGVLRAGEHVLVTSEPAGGSSRPTRRPLLDARV
jgi:anti-sigma-K factor RskA